jgi:hypothetical protein
MSKKDYLEEMLRELPSEKAPKGFTHKVMHQVMADWSLNPVLYKPVISKRGRGWWAICFSVAASILLLFIVPDTTTETSQKIFDLSFISGFNFQPAITKISQLLSKLTNFSPAVGIGSLAIVALWFFDQLFTKLARN